jgi:FAD/FMN-containing dehydrogenase
MTNSDPTNADHGEAYPFRISRRLFLAGGMAAAGSLFIGTFDPEKTLAANKAKFNVDDLRKAVNCDISVPGDANFKDKVYGGLWNRYYPNRAPQVAVHVKTDKDVMAAIKFARANNLKVVVRGGGHNWCSPSLRNGGMMIDLTLMNKVISIDAEKKLAVVEPIISNREIQAHLKPHNLAFPSGHCPQVKISGYLLGGGMSWNQGVWGPGVGSVEKIELVTADGELIVADKDHNKEYFWAARGSGCGFFAVAVRYHLRLYDLPKAIIGSAYYYPLDQTEEVSDWIGKIAPKMNPAVEMSLWVMTAPPELADQTKKDNGKVCVVTGTAFADSEEKGIAMLAPLDTCPAIGKCISKPMNKPFDFEALFDSSGALWPENLRSQVEAMFSNSNPADIMKAVKAHLVKAPSPTSVFMYAVFTGPNVPAKLPDAAFSMSAKLYGGPWTMWKDSADDAANVGWHKELLTLLKPFASGHYISETDSVDYPEHAVKAFSPVNWKKIAELRKKYDPAGVFFNYTDGLS